MAHTILIVEDHSATRDWLTALLAGAGYKTVTAASVPSAQQALAEVQPDLLVTDVRLDAHNGLQLIAMAPRPIPAIVLSGVDDPSVRAAAQELGADFLVKPVPGSVLCDLIAQRLGGAADQRPFVSRRRSSRKRVMTTAVHVGQAPARLLDVSDSGVGLEVHGIASATLPQVVTLSFDESGVSVSVDVTWKRRRDDTTWLCGGAISSDALPQWRAFIDTLA